MIQIPLNQFKNFSEASRLTFVDRLTIDCQQKFPVICRTLNDAALKSAVTSALETAKFLGFERQGGARLVTEYSLLFGCGFHDDPLHSWAATALNTHEAVTEKRRARKLMEAAHDFIRSVTRPPAQHPAIVIETMRRLLSQSGFGLPDENWQRVLAANLALNFPERARAAGESAFVSLVDRALDELNDYSSPDEVTGAAILMTAYGHRCFNDPALIWLRQALDLGGIMQAQHAACERLPKPRKHQETT